MLVSFDYSLIGDTSILTFTNELGNVISFQLPDLSRDIRPVTFLKTASNERYQYICNTILECLILSVKFDIVNDYATLNEELKFIDGIIIPSSNTINTTNCIYDSRFMICFEQDTMVYLDNRNNILYNMQTINDSNDLCRVLTNNLSNITYLSMLDNLSEDDVPDLATDLYNKAMSYMTLNTIMYDTDGE